MKRVALPVVLFLFQCSLSALSGVAQEVSSITRSPGSPEFTLHSSSNLVLVNVLALNARNRPAGTALRQDDFQVFDNGRPVSLKTFDSGAQARPLALWFVVLCNMDG
jgi:hypothetical protein